MSAETVYYNFEVSVKNGVYTIYTVPGNKIVSGDLTITSRTVAKYTLKSDSSDLEFVSPVIVNNSDPYGNLSHSFLDNNNVIEITDSDDNSENIGFKLATRLKNDGSAPPIISSDPQWHNRPPV